MNQKTLSGCLFVVLIIAGGALAQIPIIVNEGALPSMVDNGASQYFRPIFNQMGNSCGNANGVSYSFNYEINATRGLSAKIADNQYPYAYTYHFLNDGSPKIGTSHMYIDSWVIIKENGIPNVTDFGGFIDGYPTKWLSGYESYFRGMHNRVDKIDSVDLINDPIGLTKLKQWLYDRGNGTKPGGVANLSYFYRGTQYSLIQSGPEKGKKIITRFGTSSDHANTIVGYNDDIRFDFNRDGEFTNNKDINGDNRVTQADWEIGALILANSHGTGSGNNGFIFCPYRLLFMNEAQGGIKNGNRFYFMTVKKNYKPEMTFKIKLTHPIRNQIALSVGIAPGENAPAPVTTRPYEHQYTYAGGKLPLGGNSASATIEIGLDITDLLGNGSAPGNWNTFFLIVDAKSDLGELEELTLMDYSSGSLVEIPAKQKNKPFQKGRTLVPVIGKTKPLAVKKAKGMPPARFIQIRSIHGTNQMILPMAVEVLSIYDIKGTRIASFRDIEPGEWPTMDGSFPRGLVWARTTDRGGTVRIVPLLR